MLNSYSKAYNNLNINAVSGTLIKSHPKSFFKILHSNSELADTIFNPEPTMDIGERKSYDYHKRETVSIIVLQTMLTGSDKYDIMIEIVRESDYLNVEGEE